MAFVQDGLAFTLADSCSNILEPLLCFLGELSPRAAIFLALVLPLACITGVIVAHFARIVLAHLHPVPGTAMSLADLGRFSFMLCTLVFVWLFAMAGLLALYNLFFVAGKHGMFGWNVLS